MTFRVIASDGLGRRRVYAQTNTALSTQNNITNNTGLQMHNSLV
jgi:hypothetical protein